ncbi:hypothetical protein [Spiroplasma endosymbiont of Sarcophaga carnaria]|uniref:hypothetical protein n=1 Tax=Spiroplasma endosymbiont of Sarcophaga carnaria TaxID=3066303 RepID=UPI0030CBE858
MKRWSYRIWYKDYLWYYKVIIASLAFAFLAYGFYADIFKEFWYVNKNAYRSSLQNYDILLSFYSVQVNIITIAWLLLAIFNHHREQKSWFFSTNFKLSILNWNLLMFFIFWIGIVIGYKNGEVTIADYTKAQISCTVVTHFIMPILFFVYTPLSFGDHRLSWKKEFLTKDWWISLSYPIFYLMYVLIRAAAWNRDGDTIWAYPYPFLDIDNPIITWLTKVQATFFIIFLFTVVFTAFHVALQSFNNGMYRVFNKYQSQTLWYERIYQNIKQKCQIKNIDKKQNSDK